jgi:hypothetical protein
MVIIARRYSKLVIVCDIYNFDAYDEKEIGGEEEEEEFVESVQVFRVVKVGKDIKNSVQ